MGKITFWRLLLLKRGPKALKSYAGSRQGGAGCLKLLVLKYFSDHIMLLVQFVITSSSLHTVCAPLLLSMADNVSHQWEAGTATDQPMRERHVPRSRCNDRLRHCAEPITVITENNVLSM